MKSDESTLPPPPRKHHHSLKSMKMVLYFVSIFFIIRSIPENHQLLTQKRRNTARLEKKQAKQEALSLIFFAFVTPP